LSLNSTIRHQIPLRAKKYGRPLVTANSGAITGTRQPSNRFAIWLVLIGILMPAAMTFYIGGAKFYPARAIIVLLLIPAVFVLSRRGRRFVLCDLFACATSAWMIGAMLLNQQYDLISSAVAEVLEFLGAYIVARAFIFEKTALNIFVEGLKYVVIIMIAFAVLDHVSGRLITHDTVARLWGLYPWEPEFRHGMLRATSIFDHPILYGTFCAVAGAIFFYSERIQTRRMFYVGICLFGCFLAMSSAPILSFGVVIFVYCYDQMLKKYHWRWKAFTIAIVTMLIVIYLSTNNPTSWIVSHLTLDPSTGYFRKATWERSFYNISFSPITGYGFNLFGDPNEFFDKASVDSVWLVVALRFGIPMVIFLLLTNFASFFPSSQSPNIRACDIYLKSMSTGMTLAVMVLTLAGLTVHYWNTIWLFWGLCIGIRGSLQEWAKVDRQRSRKNNNREAFSARAI